MATDSEENDSEEKTFRCDVDYEDWINIANSEFIDYVEGRQSVGFVFDHEEIGLHGIKFDQTNCVLRAVSFKQK